MAEQIRDMKDWMRAIERRVANTNRGITGVARQTTQQVQDELNKDRDRRPAAPVELTAQTYVALDDATKKMRGGVTVDFADVVVGSDAQPITIDRYEMYGRNVTAGDETFGFVTTSEISSTTGFGYKLGDVWEFKVRARGRYTLRPGDWSAPISVQVASDTTPPPQPTAPVATASGAVIRINYDGLSVSGAMPTDLDYIIVAGGTDPSPTTEIDRFMPGGPGVGVYTAPYNTPMFYRLRAVDRSGLMSPWSVQATAMTAPLVDADIILSVIDAANTQIINVGEESLKSGAILSRHLAENAVSQAALQDNIVTATKLATTVANDINTAVTDSAAAVSTANTANTTAGNAQTAATTAQTAADKAAEAAITGDAYSLNPSFDDWTAANPNWFTNYGTGPTKSTTIVKRGNVSARFNATAADHGLNFNGMLNHAPNLEYFTVEVQFYLASGTSLSGAGVLLDWGGLTGGNRAQINLKDEFPTPVTGKWYTLVKTVRRPTTATGTFTAMDGYLMANWSGHGALTVKDIHFDWLNIRPASVEEIQSYGTPSELTRIQNLADAAQLKANAAFDDAQTALTNAGLAQTAANGKNAVYYTSSAPAGTGHKVNDIWFRLSDNKVHLWDGDSWEARADTAIATAQTAANNAASAASAADTKAVNAQTAANNAATAASNAQTAGDNAAILANSIVKTSTSDATGTPPSVGAIWNKTNAGGDLIIRTWTANSAGTAWVERKLDDAVIGNLNAATINAGIINAARFNAADIRAKFLEAGKITANDIVAGTLTSASGVFGTVDASILNAGTLNAARLNAGDVRAKFLAAGLIQAVDMVAGTITAASGVIGSLDIGKVTAGKLHGSYIEARTLLASALMVSDLTNLAPAPTYAMTASTDEDSDWALTNQFEVVASSLDASGFRFHVSNATTDSRAYGPIMTVYPGEKLYMGANLYRASGTAAAYLRIQFLDKNKASIAYTTAPMATTSPDGTRFEGVAEAPASAAYAQLYMHISVATGETGFYNVVGRRQTGTTYIEDGAVTTDKVKANSIQARHLLVGDFENRFIGSDFETAEDTPWALATGHYRTNGTAKSGTHSLNCNGAVTAAGVSITNFTGDTKVQPGEEWLFRLYGYKTGTFNGTSGNSKLRIASKQSGNILGDFPFTSFTTAWNSLPYEFSFIVPSGTTSLDISIRTDHTSGSVFLDDLQMRRMSEASLIQNLGVEKLTASTASMQQATIDKLWTDVVRSKKITTDMMIVGKGPNGIYDEYFEDEQIKTERHFASGQFGTWQRSDTAGVSLNYYGGTFTAGSNKTFHFRTQNSPAYAKEHMIPVVEGQKWALDVIYSSQIGGPRGTCLIVRKDGTTAYTSAGWDNQGWDGPGTRLKMTRVYTVPADVTHVLPSVQFSSDCNGAWVWGGSRFTNMSDASLIVDGAIVAKHLTVTDELTVKVLGAYKIKAINIDVNNLSADTGFVSSMRTNILTADVINSTTLKSDAITSKHTLTGPTIQTLATANRGIKINGTAFTAYNSGGGKTFEIVSATGAVNATGTFTTGNVGDAKYATMRQDGSGGRVDFYTGTTNQHGYIYARDLADGQQSKMTLGINDPDVTGENMPVLGLSRYEGRLSYGSRHIKVSDTGIVIDGNAFNDNRVVELYGGLDMMSSKSRVTFRNQSAVVVGHVGNRPESNFSDFEVRADVGNVRLTAPSGSSIISATLYAITTGSAANVYVATDGKMYRSTSASRYKTDQRVLDVPDSLLDVEMKDWVDRTQLEKFYEMDPMPRPFTEEQQAEYDAIDLAREPGVIAEDVEALGGTKFTVYGQDGTVEGVKYDRLALAQIAILKKKLAELTARFDAMEGI